LDKAYQNFEEVLIIDSLSVTGADAFHNKALLIEVLHKKGDTKILIDRAISIYRKHKEQLKLANALLNLGNAERRDAQHAKALKHLIEAAQLFEQLNNKSSLGKVYDAIGAIQEFQYNFKTAKRYYLMAFEIFKSTNQKEYQSNLLNNLGTVYRSLAQIDSSIICFHKSIELKQQLGIHQQIAATYHNLASTYLKDEKLNQAEKYYHLALELKRGNDSTSCAYSFNELGHIETQKGNYKEAGKYLDSSNMFNVRNDVSILLRNFENKADLFEGMGDYKSAYKARTLYADLYESNQNRQQTNVIQGLQESFEASEKLSQIASLKQQGEALSIESSEKSEMIAKQSEQIKQRNIFILIISGSLLLMLLIVFIIYQRIKLRQSRKSISIQEVIKKEMGEDLHEIVVSNLHGIRLMTESLSDAEPNVTNQIVEKISNNLHDISAQVRFIAHRLSPITKKLEQFKFTEILENDFTEFELYTSISINRREIPVQLNELSERQKNSFYGIIREVLNNISKHSQADSVTIQFKIENRNLICVISDNGKGFLNESNAGIGIQNIEARSADLNGKISISSSSQGTKTVIIFPHKLRSL
jgi:signal transduction histidine kinase